MANSNYMINLNGCQEVFVYEVCNFLKCKFNVDINVHDETSLILKNKYSHFIELKNVVDNFRSLEKQHILNIENYSKDVLLKHDVKMYFSTKYNVLMSVVVEDNILYLFGNIDNMTNLYNFLAKYQKLTELSNSLLSEIQKRQLINTCKELNIEYPNLCDNKSQLFFYNIIINRNELDFPMSLNESLDQLKLNEVPPPPKDTPDPENVFENDISIKDPKYRTIIIDGSNVAYGHGGDKFSTNGVKLAVEYFVNLGHPNVYVLIPRHRQPLGGSIFEQLIKDDHLKYTPSRKINEVRETPYDDRLILDAAISTDGVVVSNDQYRDLMNIEKYKKIISHRLIPYTFVGDHIIIPTDPYGPNGPSLNAVLMQNNVEVTRQTQETRSVSPTNSPTKAKFKQKRRQSNSKNPTNQLFENAGTHHNSLPYNPHHNKSRPYQVNIHQKSNKQQHQHHQPRHNSQNRRNQQQLQQQQQQQQPNLSLEQTTMYNQIIEIIPSLNNDVYSVIQSNPTIKDPNTIVELVMLSRPKH